jgi:histidyl-tRNA synthetase
MRDFLPQSVAERRYVIGVIVEIYERYGFLPLETPAIENLSTLLGKYGQEGDELLYRLLHRRDALARALSSPKPSERDLADQGLRYDLTVPLARVVAQYPELPRYFRRYQIQPVWRADRPGKGRFREFYQCDVDIVGTESLLAEAEVCAAAGEVFERLGFRDYTLRVNHRQLLRALIEAAGIDGSREQEVLIAVDKLDKVGREGVERELEERGIEAAAAKSLIELVLGSEESDDERLNRLRNSLISDAGRFALGQVRELLDLMEATPLAGRARFHPELARGLSYYTGPIFEVTVPDLAGSLAGGGRYDELIGMFGKESIAAVGLSLGLERILLVMAERNMYPELGLGPQVMLCWMGVPPASALEVAHRLRAEGLRVEVFPSSAGLGKQLQYCNSVKVPVAAILGERELKDQTLTLKRLETGEQKTVSLAEAAATLRGWLGRE